MQIITFLQRTKRCKYAKCQSNTSIKNGERVMVIMSHRSNRKQGRTRILSYSQTVLQGPNVTPCPLITAMTSHVAQDTLKSAETHKAVVKVKRKRTRRELNQAKFGKVVVEKLFKYNTGHVISDMPAMKKRHCQSVGNPRAAEDLIPKRSLNPSWIITQNRLTQHLGIFNKEVKSIDIERLLKDGQTEDSWPDITKASTVQDVLELAGCTPMQGEAAVSVPAPKPQAAAEDGACITQVSSAELVAPTADLAQKLVQTLNPRHVFSGKSLAHSMQRHLLNVLVERHGGLPSTWVLAGSRKQEPAAAPCTGLSWIPRRGSNSLEENTVANKFLSPKDQLTDDPHLLQTDGSVCGLPDCTSPTTVTNLLYMKVASGCSAGERMFSPTRGAPVQSEFCPRRDISLPGPQVGPLAAVVGTWSEEEHAFSTSGQPCLWPWRNAGDLLGRKVAVRKAKSAALWSTFLSPSQDSLLERTEGLPGALGQAESQADQRPLACIPEARKVPFGWATKSLWMGCRGQRSRGQRSRGLLCRDTALRRECQGWEDEVDTPAVGGSSLRVPASVQDLRLQQPHVEDHLLLAGLPWPSYQLGPGQGFNTHGLGTHCSSEKAVGTGPPNRHGSREGDCQPQEEADSDSCHHGLGPASGKGSGGCVPLSFYYPPSDCLDWSESPLPGWEGSAGKRGWVSRSPEPWVFPRMRLY
ncbi:proline-rich protein 19 isoform X2 [Narcine bancroftii]|uniref:proline-rich protein 19 isoform X2 n=1 Tax=Narcine bancroftii TaxID=1343680 RepID=UPI0038310EDA